MLRIQMIGLALVAAIAMSALAAGSASGEVIVGHQWLLIHHQPNGTQIHLLLKAPLPVHTEGLVLLEDEKATGGAVRIHCHGFDAGTVGPHGLDLVKLVTLELLGTKHRVGCKFDKAGACTSSVEPTVEAIHLPWHTKLVLQGGIVRDLILGDGNGAPGWAVTCETILGPVTDTCTEEEGKPASTIMENITGEGVLAKFESKSGSKANCSLGGRTAGTVEGFDLTKNPSSTLLLAISPLLNSEL